MDDLLTADEFADRPREGSRHNAHVYAEYHRLAAEQAALRRVAALVALPMQRVSTAACEGLRSSTSASARRRRRRRPNTTFTSRAVVAAERDTGRAMPPRQLRNTDCASHFCIHSADRLWVETLKLLTSSTVFKRLRSRRLRLNPWGCGRCGEVWNGDRLAHNPEVASAEYACPWIEEPRERRSTARRRVDVRVPPCTVGHALHRRRSGKVAYGAHARSCPGLADCDGDRPGRRHRSTGTRQRISTWCGENG